MEEEECHSKVEQGYDLDLVPAPKAAPVKLVLSPNGTQDDGAPRPQKKLFVDVEPPQPESGPLQPLVYKQKHGQEEEEVGEVYAHRVDVEEAVDEAVLKPGLIDVFKEEV